MRLYLVQEFTGHDPDDAGTPKAFTSLGDAKAEAAEIMNYGGCPEEMELENWDGQEPFRSFVDGGFGIIIHVVDI